ncbi:MAG TPA: Gfo/Idh/MocA family oxidoreductase [Gaiellaceae bacterium]|jgi:myo-inositol 2-dehydrogenase/D-chiro-inositol 1-dehydrogenase|nr:Gfo/Idh/MocA family oxidoreductase [Gaiellaceae bacterium]
MRLAVLGTGRMGAFRAEWLRRRPEVEEVLVASRDPARGRPVGEVLDAEPDAVVISSETAEHPTQIAACAAKGMTMLCEKPVALTLRETSEALGAVERGGATLQISFQRRFDPEFARAQKLASSGALGTLYCVRLNSYDHEPSPERYIPTSGGIFRDLHVHDFDQARWLTGLEVEEVYAAGAVRKWERFARHGDADTAVAVLTMAGGLPVVVTGTRHDPRGYDFRAELLGSDDFVAMGPSPDDNPYRGFLDRFAAAFDAELEAFLGVVRGERENPCPGGEALEALRVAVACDRSRAEGRPVRLQEVDDDAA